MTESFVFYNSYLKGIESLSKKSQLNLFLAVTRYALRDEEPVGLTQAERGVFELIKPTIDANAKHRAKILICVLMCKIKIVICVVLTLIKISICVIQTKTQNY